SFLQDGDLWLWNQQTGELVQATHSAVPLKTTVTDTEFYSAEAEFNSYRWSPDSRYIALSFEDRRGVRKEVVPNYLGDETSVNLFRRDYTGDHDAARLTAIYWVSEGRLRFLDLPDNTDRRFSNYN